MSDICAGRHGGNAESVAAYEQARRTAPRDRARIVRYGKSRHVDGFTCDEAEVALGMRHQTASARISELVRDGTLIRTAARRTTRSGQSARVLVVAEELL